MLALLLLAIPRVSAPDAPGAAPPGASTVAVPEVGLSGLPASFVGDLPCADCPAVRYHLDLFADGSFFLRTTYIDRPVRFDEIGHWVVADGHLLKLQTGDAVSDQFEITTATTLRKLDRTGNRIDSKLNFDLKRQAAFAPIEPSLQMRGLYAYMADAGWFTECSSRKRFPVAQEGDNAALEAAYSKSRPNPGDSVLAMVDARIAMRAVGEGGSERLALVVDHFHGLATHGCEEPRTHTASEGPEWMLARLALGPGEARSSAP
jgi:copper homeostasis protein (lipoprotein)